MTKSERSRRFDSYVQSVDRAVSHPEVIQALGRFASMIAETNARAFLPNVDVEKRRLIIPRKYRGDLSAPVLLPIWRGEDEWARTAADQLNSTECGRFRTLSGVAISSVTGASMAEDELFSYVMTQHGSKAPEAVPDPTASVLARTLASTYTIRIGETLYYTPVRPVMTIDADQLEDCDMWNQAGIITHEELHVRDINEHPLLHVTPRGAVASEFVSHRSSRVMFDMTDQPFEPQSTAYEVEDWRQKHLGEGSFVPADSDLPMLMQLVGH